MKQYPRYEQRRTLRALEKTAAWLERAMNRAGGTARQFRPYNPLYHLGTLTIFLVIFLTVTGAYLTIFYRPGTDQAYQSVAGMSATWFGSLMRTSHRYAADGLLLVALLHAFKTFISDRFWGSRWLAWVSGLVMLPLFWVIGLMGYWLVWDDAAQWLTEYFINIFGGAFAYSFLGTNLSAGTYSLFVIILFLHIFVPILLVIGIIIHVLRLSRPRYWAPRWLMVTASLVLLVLAVALPVSNAVPADLTRLLDRVNVDGWYMGFLPLARRLGNPLFWLTAVGVNLLVMALPWLRRGQHDGPAQVILANCTGCGACARECPYDAIQMVHRDDETEFQSLAVVKPSLCTGCGICVGSCPDIAIELERLPSTVVRQDLQRTLKRSGWNGKQPVTIYACERHAGLGSLPPLEQAPGTIPLLQAKLPPRVNLGAWAGDQGELLPVMTCVVPCTGMLHPNWAAETIEAGGAGAMVISCPADDCSHREGPHWISGRLKRRRTLRQGNVHFLEMVPGDADTVLDLWRSLTTDGDQASTSDSVVGRHEAAAETMTPAQRLRTFLPSVAILLLVFLISLLAFQPGRTGQDAAQAQIRLVINHAGEFKDPTSKIDADVLARLPDNVDPSQVLGGERYPVHLRLDLDGETVYEEVYQPRGLRHEGSIYGVSALPVQPGSYKAAIWLMDDEVEWRQVFQGEVEIGAGHSYHFVFSESADRFQLRLPPE